MALTRAGTTNVSCKGTEPKPPPYKHEFRNMDMDTEFQADRKAQNMPARL